MYRCALLIPVLLLAQLSSAPALATPSTDDSGKVLVNGTRNPELKPYRVMSAGLDAFDKYHALAPAAPDVRFKLRPMSGDPSVDMNGLALRIAGNTTSIPLPLNEDHMFTLPRSSAATEEDADLVLNKKKGNYRWQPMIQSAGVPPGMRRLGDLRLECHVAVAVAKREMSFMERAFVATLLGSTEWCSSGRLNWGVATTRPVRSATLILGERRMAFPLSDDRMGYTALTSDTTLPDEALVEIQFADESQESKSQ